MDPLWVSDMSLLYANGRWAQLFPTREMTFAERVNSLVRLIILASACIYLYNHNISHVLYGAASAAILTFVAGMGPSQYPRKQPTAINAPTCTHPTPNNPFGNVLLTDYKYNPDRPPACFVDDVQQEIKQAYAANMCRDAGDIDWKHSGFDRYHTMPDTTTWQAGRDAFAQAVYGTGETCKTDQALCGKLGS